MLKVSISVDVSDMEKAVLFYSEGLGCERVSDGTDITILSADNVSIYLLKKAPGSNPLLRGSASRNYERHWTPVHVDFSVDDLEQALSSILEFGGSYEDSETGEWGSIAYCADPFGNGFCLVKMFDSA